MDDRRVRIHSPSGDEMIGKRIVVEDVVEEDVPSMGMMDEPPAAGHGCVVCAYDTWAVVTARREVRRSFIRSRRDFCL